MIPTSIRGNHTNLRELNKPYGDLDASVRDLREQLDRAARELNRPAEAACAFDLGELYYRLGAARAAHDFYARALSLWQQFRLNGSDRLAAEHKCAMAALRAGRLDQALTGWVALLRHPACAKPAVQAELMATLALTAARRGDRVEAAAFAARAAAMVAGSSDADAARRVHRLAGEALLALGDSSAAIATFQRARAVQGAPAVPAERLALLVDLMEVGVASDAEVREALLLVPEALQDGNAWWDLPRLLPHVLAWNRRRTLLDASERCAATRLVVATAQRRDAVPIDTCDQAIDVY